MEKKRRNTVAIIILIAVVLVITGAVVPFILSGQKKKESYRFIRVKDIDGTVTVARSDSDAFDAFEDLQLVSEDTVEVKEKSFLELIVDDDKHIGAEENTGFIVHATGNEKNGNITIDLLYGKSLFTIDKKLADGSEFIVKSPNATISVRGTSFSVEYNKETAETIVEVFDGTVWVDDNNGETQVIEAGSVTTVVGGSEVSQSEVSPDETRTTNNNEIMTITRTVADSGRIDVGLLLFAEGNTAYGSYIYVDGNIWNPDVMSATSKSLYEIETAYIIPHIDEVNDYYYSADENAKKNVIVPFYPATEWFPTELTVMNDDGTSYTCHIGQVHIEADLDAAIPTVIFHIEGYIE